MTTLADMPATAPWTPADLRGWRARLRWTQARAAEALCFHVEAYKKLECGTRAIGPRVRRLCLLIEREHARSLFHASGVPGSRQAFATAERVTERLEALRRDGRLVGRGGRDRTRYVSLFSGIEAATAALERVGSDALAVAFAETDQAANSVLRHRWPDVPRVGDIAEFDWSALLGQVDLVVGGSPCQPFSIAGRRLGIADPRGNLALHFLRAVGAMRPRWFLFENVPGLLSANGGADFDVFLSAVEELGYACAWRMLDARYFGLAQRRRRLWIVAERGGSGRGPCEVLDIGKGEEGRALQGREAWKAAPGRAEGRARGLNLEDADWSDPAAWAQPEEPASAACQGGGGIPPRPQGGIMAFKPLAGAAARGIGMSSTEVPTLASASGGNRVPGILYAADLRHCTVGERAMTIQVGPAGGWSLNATPCAVEERTEGFVLRRFTPLECLRLQGFDDAWLDGVRVGGRPLTDSDRYRLIGNSWPVPVAAWLLERLLAYDAAEREAPVGR